jgi:hypothetical protein
MIVPADEYSSVVLGESAQLRALLTQVSCIAGRDRVPDAPGEKALARVVGSPRSLAEVSSRSVLAYIEYITDAEARKATIGYLCWQRELDMQELFDLLPRFEPGASSWYLHIDRDLDLFVVGLGFELAASPGPTTTLHWRDPVLLEAELKTRGLWSEIPPGVSLVKHLGPRRPTPVSAVTPATMALPVMSDPRVESLPPSPPSVPSLPPLPSLPSLPSLPILPFLPLPEPDLDTITFSYVPGQACARSGQPSGDESFMDQASIEVMVRFFARPREKLTDEQVKLAVDPVWQQVATSSDFAQALLVPDGLLAVAVRVLPQELQGKFEPLRLLGQGNYGLVMRVRSTERQRLEVLKVSRVDRFLKSNSEADLQRRAHEVGLAPELYEGIRFRLADPFGLPKRIEALAMEQMDMTLYRAFICAQNETQELELCDALNRLLRRLDRVCFTHGDLHLRNIVLKLKLGPPGARLQLIDFARSSFRVYEPQIDWLQVARGFHFVWEKQGRQPQPQLLDRAFLGLDLAPELRSALPSLAALESLYLVVAQKYRDEIKSVESGAGLSPAWATSRVCR